MAAEVDPNAERGAPVPARPDPAAASGADAPPADAGTGASASSPLAERALGLLWQWGKIGLRIALPALVIWLVWRDLRLIDFRRVRAALANADPTSLLLAALCTAVAIASMGLYDAIAFRSTPELSASRRWRLGMLFFSWTNFLTLGPLGGPAVRLYYYRRAGLDTGEIVRGLTRLYAGVFCGLAGWSLAAFAPLGPLGDGRIEFVARAALAVVLSPAIATAVGAVARRFRRLGGAAPWRTYLALGLASVVDWGGVLGAFVFAGRAVGVHLPESQSARALFLGHVTGVLSMIPGGLGSADAVWLTMLKGAGIGENTGAACVLLYRAVFYLLPWGLSLIALYLMFAHRWGPAVRWQRRILAGAVGLNGVVLLASAATPAVRDRLHAVAHAVPLGAIEASYATAIIAAATMLFLVRGLLRGYRGAFIITGAALTASIVAHLLKGGDYEEAGVSLILLLLLLGARRSFTRRGRVPIGWELTLAAAFGSLAFFLILGLTAFRHVEYHDTLWTHFAARAEASRFLRGGVALAAVGAAFVIRQAMLPVRQRVDPSDGEIDRAVGFIRAHADHAAALNIGAGDKAVWMWEDRGLVVFQRTGDSIVVFSDPVVARRGDENALLRALHAMADDDDLDLVFYQITSRWMEHLHDFGYTFFKLGEEAVVPVAGFDLAGGEASQFRKTVRRVEGAGVSFRVEQPPHAPGLIDACRDVSDAWLAHRSVEEMQFSLGYFSPGYLQRFPLGLATDDRGRVVAFANLLGTRPGCEATFDFMRYRPDAVDNVMDYVIIQTMLWAAGEGYATLNLGMSPLFAVGHWRKASIVERAARLLYKHGERLYNYRGLQEYKRKFHPAWEPRYMAYQRPWDWPSAVLAATGLIKARSREARRRIAAARLGKTTTYARGAFDEGRTALPAAPSSADGTAGRRPAPP